MNCITSPSQSTEEKIREAAKQVFLRKGFDGATSKDIAEAAGMNVALTNYYFRSKEKLFISIFDEMIQLFFNGIIEIMDQPLSLREKITALIEYDFQLLKSNPDLAIFVMNEIHRHPERLAHSIGTFQQIQQSVFENQIQQESALGTIRPIRAVDLLPLIFCNIQFLFVSKAMHMKVYQITEAEFDAFSNSHKNLVIDMLNTYLFETPKATIFLPIN